MGHVRDRWTTRDPETGRKRRNDRWGKGRRWQARWVDQRGVERVQACTTEDEAQAVLSRVAVGLPTRSAPTMTVSEYAERWQRGLLHHAPTTTMSVATAVKVRILPTLGDLPLSEVTRATVQDAVTAWAQTCAPSTVRVTYSHLHSMLAAAVLDGMIGASPCQSIRLPPRGPGRLWMPTTAQVEALHAAMVPAGQPMVVVAAASGLRPGELRGLRVGNAGRLVRVVEQATGPTKTRSSVRTVDIGARAWSVLEPLVTGRDASEYVWASRRGDPLARSTINTRWTVAADGLGFPAGSGWHSLRHYHASLLIARGLSPTAVASRLGHSDATETLSTYAHVWPDDESRAVAAVDAEMGWVSQAP